MFDVSLLAMEKYKGRSVLLWLFTDGTTYAMVKPQLIILVESVYGVH